MANLCQMERCKYMWLIGFQGVLVVLFFIFVKYATVGSVLSSVTSAPTLGGVASAVGGVLSGGLASAVGGVASAITGGVSAGVSAAQTAVKTATASGFEGTHVMIYVGFGFLMTFLMKYCYGALGINMLLAALTAQWSIFTQGVFHMHDNTIFLTKRLIIEADIMSASILITFGALIGRANVNQLLTIAIIEAAIGSGNLYLMSDVFKVSDVGGSIGIHAFGAFFGLGVSAAWAMGRSAMDLMNPERQSYMSDVTSMMGRNAQRILGLFGHGRKSIQGNENTVVAISQKEKVKAHPLENPNYDTDLACLIGTLFLFIYWPIFNSCMAIGDRDTAIINTYLSLAACTVVTFALSAFLGHGKFDMEHIQNSTLAGGVGIGTVANMNIGGPGGAIIIGMCASVISVFGLSKVKPFFVRKWGLHDTCGVMHLHGFPGVYSGIVSFIVAIFTKRDMYGYAIFPAFLTNDRSNLMQGVFQLIATIATIVIAGLFGFLCGLLTKLRCFNPLGKGAQFNDGQFWDLPKLPK